MRRPFHSLSNHRIESRVLLLFVVLLAGVMILAKAASEITEGDTIAFDRAVVLALRFPGDPSTPIGPQWLTEAMIDLTALGSVSVLTLITCLATGYLLVERKPATAGYMLAAVGGGALAGTLLKTIYARARPDIVTHLVGTHSASFPSAHAMNSAIVYLTLAVLLARTARRRWVRIYLISAAITLTVLVGFTRIYLGVHWPTDVLAGWIVGGLWAVACSLAAKQLQARMSIEGSG
ncbi:MAG: phosphatase PAP2 family protein [Porphyrobacter sp.]|nr:phosphatase PAP2 family protein [Porphyrobacter sp.]